MKKYFFWCRNRKMMSKRCQINTAVQNQNYSTCFSYKLDPRWCHLSTTPHIIVNIMWCSNKWRKHCIFREGWWGMCHVTPFSIKCQIVIGFPFACFCRYLGECKCTQTPDWWVTLKVCVVVFPNKKYVLSRIWRRVITFKRSSIVSTGIVRKQVSAKTFSPFSCHWVTHINVGNAQEPVWRRKDHRHHRYQRTMSIYMNVRQRCLPRRRSCTIGSNEGVGVPITYLTGNFICENTFITWTFKNTWIRISNYFKTRELPS